jgi:hypothetical protein
MFVRRRHVAFPFSGKVGEQLCSYRRVKYGKRWNVEDRHFRHFSAGRTEIIQLWMRLSLLFSTGVNFDCLFL